MESKPASRRIRPPHRVIVRAPGLLPMLYKVSELAMEIGVPDSTMRGWLDLGAPHQHDSGGHLWIHGRDFAGWVEGLRRPRREGRLADDEAFCMSCRRVVKMKKPVWKPIKGKLVHIIGKCPECGHRIQRGGRVAGSG
jgi:DNA-directed RNA polymerase subunit RPC12/RpoP